MHQHQVVNGADEPFKVIIVGGGCAGLTLAHCLHKAGYDYVVLDKHEIAPAWGASITMMPCGGRILHQLGVMEEVEKKCIPMINFYNRDSKGRLTFAGDLLHEIRTRMGYIPYTLERRKLLQALYDTLPDKSKIHEHARVHEIEEVDSKIRVLLADGTMHEGDLVVGCDGVHSIVRELMWKRVLAEESSLIPLSEKQSLKAEYQCLVGVTPTIPGSGLGIQDMTNVSNDKFSFLLLCQPEAAYYLAIIKLPPHEQVQYPTRRRYTEAETEATAAKYFHWPVTESITFGELWQRKTRGHLVNLEEGVLETWSHGRMVLCGDAAHKVTPNSGLGGNLALEDAVGLANEIHRLVQRHPNKLPSDTELKPALDKYKEGRLPRVKTISERCRFLTRMQAYDGWFNYLLYRWALPYVLGKSFLSWDASRNSYDAPILNYVPFTQQTGTMAWKKIDDPDCFVNDPAWQASQMAPATMVNGIHPKKLAAPSMTPDADVSEIAGLAVPVTIGTLVLFGLALLWIWGAAPFYSYTSLAKTSFRSGLAPIGR